jgi:hypothetical protein
MHRERSVAPWLASPWLLSPWLSSPSVLNTGWVGGLGLPAVVVMGNEASLHALATKNVAKRRMLPKEECCQKKNVARNKKECCHEKKKNVARKKKILLSGKRMLSRNVDVGGEK